MAHRWWGASRYIQGSYFNKLQGTLFYEPDLSRVSHNNEYFEDHSLRLTWQVSPKHKIVGSFSQQNNCSCPFGLTGVGGINAVKPAPESRAWHVYNPQFLPLVSWSAPGAPPNSATLAAPWSAGTQIKFLAVYPLPWSFQISATYQNIAGIPITATYPAPNAQVASALGRNLASCRGAATCNANVNVELVPPATRYEDRLQQLDLRFTRLFKLERVTLLG